MNGPVAGTPSPASNAPRPAEAQRLATARAALRDLVLDHFHILNEARRTDVQRDDRTTTSDDGYPRWTVSWTSWSTGIDGTVTSSGRVTLELLFEAGRSQRHDVSATDSQGYFVGMLDADPTFLAQERVLQEQEVLRQALDGPSSARPRNRL